MAWTIFTPELADALLGPKELAAIATHLELDARANVLRRVVAKVRGFCANLGELGPAGSVPPECEDALATLYRFALLANLPTSSLMTDARRQEKEEAEKFLKLVAERKVGITRPGTVETGPEDLSGSGPVSPSICAPKRRRDRAGLDGS